LSVDTGKDAVQAAITVLMRHGVLNMRKRWLVGVRDNRMVSFYFCGVLIVTVTTHFFSRTAQPGAI
jgi:hypothetical protein